MPETPALPQTYLPRTEEKYMTEREVRALISEFMLNFAGLFRVRSGTIQSGNYIEGSAGWRINALGNLEANDGTFRGEITATSGDISGDLAITGTLTGGNPAGLQLKVLGDDGKIEFYYNSSRVGYLVGISSGDMALDSDKDLYFSANGTQGLMIVGATAGSVTAGDAWMRTSGSKLYWSSGRYLKDAGSYLEVNGGFVASGGIRCNDGYNVKPGGGTEYSGANGTFTDGSGNTVRVRGGIITDLTE